MPEQGVSIAPRRFDLLFNGAWILLLVVCLWVLAAGLPVYYRVLSDACHADDCLYFQLNPQDIAALQIIGLTSHFYAAYMLGLTVLVLCACLGLALMIRWQARTAMATLTSLALIALAPTFFSALTDTLVQQNGLWQWPVGLLQAIGVWLLVVLMYLFPNGRFYPRWIWTLALLLIFPSLAFLFSSIPAALQADTFLEGSPLYVLLASMLIGVVSQGLRYRRVSGPLEKQQIKWGVYGFALMAVTGLIFVLMPVLFPTLRQPGAGRTFYYLIGGTLNVAGTLFLLFSIAMAVFRYRLWDVDLLIRRTLLYGALTATLLVIYFSAIVTLQSFLRYFAGQASNSPVVVVVSTLAIAALFNPLRRRIQEGIDRRFYRQRYDAEQTLERFAAGLRDEVDLEQISNSLLTVVRETMQPETVSLWFKATDNRS